MKTDSGSWPIRPSRDTERPDVPEKNSRAVIAGNHRPAVFSFAFPASSLRRVAGLSPKIPGCVLPPPREDFAKNKSSRFDQREDLHGGDGEIRTLARCLDAYRISSPAPERLLWKRAGQNWSVCPRIFGGVKPFSRGQPPKNGFGTNQTSIPRFGPVWQDFLEKCKISCKIIES